MFGKKVERKFKVEVSGIEVEVSQKRIKNLYLRVSKQSGKVRASVPLFITERGIREFILSRIDWIRKQQAKIKSRIPREEVSYDEGAVHYFRGNKKKLKLEKSNGKERVELIEDRIIVKTKYLNDDQKKEKLITEWYRAFLKQEIPKMIDKWEPVMGVKVNEFGVRKMKTRWGTCNINKKRIWLNLELAKKSPGCLESVVVHEMVHLLERYHNKRFYGFMDQFYPSWREHEAELESIID